MKTMAALIRQGRYADEILGLQDLTEDGKSVAPIQPTAER
jgi:hypothetical protein